MITLPSLMKCLTKGSGSNSNFGRKKIGPKLKKRLPIAHTNMMLDKGNLINVLVTNFDVFIFGRSLEVGFSGCP